MINSIKNSIAMKVYQELYSDSSLASASSTDTTGLTDLTEAIKSGTSSSDSLEISSTGAILNKLMGENLQISWDSVETLKDKFADKFKSLLKENGISSTPEFEISQDINTGKFTVSGSNPDAKKVENLLNNSDELKMSYHNMAAIASHVPAIEDSTNFAEAYMAAEGSAALQAVVAKYSYLLNGSSVSHSFSTTYGSDGASLMMDGKKVC